MMVALIDGIKLRIRLEKFNEKTTEVGMLSMIRVADGNNPGETDASVSEKVIGVVKGFSA